MNVPTVKQQESRNCYWHTYEFRHLMRDYKASNPKAYYKLGYILEKYNLLTYQGASLEDEFIGIISYSSKNLMPYKNQGSKEKLGDMNLIELFKSYTGVKE
jgi:hypothetical protein